ncbi:MAG: hypothetical protein ACYCW5_03585 [Thermoleophilia bacterium]
MNLKKGPGHRAQLEIIRRMTPEQRLMQAFELSRFTRALFRQGLRKRFPELSEEELHKLYLERLDRCHNQNY